MNYRIVVTLGPATAEEALWHDLRRAGATAFRLNTAHFRIETLRDWLQRIERFLADPDHADHGTGERAGSSPADRFPVILDLQGSKWRIGAVKPATLEEGTVVRLIPAASGGEGSRVAGAAAQILPVPHADFFTAVERNGGGKIAVNDAKVMLEVEELEAGRITARVIRGGRMLPKKGITLVGSPYRKERLSEQDTRIVQLARSYSFVRYALSYVKDAGEMRNYRRLLTAPGADPIRLIAKVERASALAEAERIARSADELWICRGDLGAEMGPARMAAEVFRLLPRLPDIRKPVLLAGQVLEHMTQHPTPTRSEISYLYESLMRGFAGVVLSDETAVGAHPIEACRSAAMFGPGQAT
jgi:pyruvate kinase